MANGLCGGGGLLAGAIGGDDCCCILASATGVVFYCFVVDLVQWSANRGEPRWPAVGWLKWLRNGTCLVVW